jgi:hypothetical protein
LASAAVVASVPAELRAQAWWLLAECLVLEEALPHAAASELQAAVDAWLVARQRAEAPEAEPAWAAWVAPELAQLAEVVLELVVEEPLRSPVAALSARPRGSLARARVAVPACTAAAAEPSVEP